MRLRGKVAVVTGQASGIGAAIARRFAAEGAAVLGVDRDRVHGEEVASAIERAGGIIAFHEADVSREPAVQGMIATCLERFGGIDVLVNNAAIQYEAPLHETTLRQWQDMLDVNLTGVFLGCKYAVPVIMARGSGVIINMSSVLGLVGDAKLAGYCATKGGILSLTRAIAVEYGRRGIRAVCICPADVDTPLNQVYFNSYPDPVAARRTIEEEYPLGRLANVDEIARVAAFLASDDAAFISGAPIVVDGGLLSRVY